MIAASIYLLKVIISSGILYGYYHLFLRNKIFHEWNRFYLLAIVPVSILLPLIDPHIIAPADNGSRIITAMQIVAGADEFTLDVNSSSGFSWSADLTAYTLYAVMCLATAFIFIRAWMQLMRTIRKYKPIALDNFYFLNTSEPGTPFSFFRYLVWNREIAIDSDSGKRILEHELVHIREKHSWDKVFLHFTLIIFWINPFFWLIRKEISMVHEFIADRKSVSNGDVEAFAKLILEASFPGHSGMLTQSFFQSSIKRRLAMITRKNNPLAAYMSRIFMIPLLFTLLFAFAVKAENMINKDNPPIMLEKKYSVEPDAGHGGENTGATASGMTGKKMNMEPVKAVKVNDTTKPGKTPPVKVTFLYLNGTSETLTIQQYRQRTGREDLTFLSDTIKVNGNALTSNYGDAVVSVTGRPLSKENAPKVVQGYSIVADTVVVGQGQNTTITGIKSVEGQQFTGEPTYYVDGWKVSAGVANAIDPDEIDKVSIKKGQNGNIIEITLKKNSKIRPPSQKPLYILEGKEVSQEELDLIDPNKIESVSVLKEKSAVTIYGEKGKYGVVLIKLKK